MSFDSQGACTNLSKQRLSYSRIIGSSKICFHEIYSNHEKHVQARNELTEAKPCLGLSMPDRSEFALTLQQHFV